MFYDSEVGSPSLPDTYLRTNGGTGTRAKKTLTFSLSDAIEPIWEAAWTWKVKSTRGTVAPARLTRPVDYLTVIEKRNDTVSLTCQPPHVWILVNEDKKNKETICFLATLLPDESYAGDPSRLGPNPEGSDYWGLAIYSDPDGTPLWGQRFENGEITNSLQFDTSYEDQAVSDVRIRMGIASGAVTRALPDESNPYDIETVECVAKKDPNDTYLVPHGGGSMPNYDDPYYVNPTGGGGATPTPPQVPKAKRLFRNSNMSDANWKKLEEMIEKIMNDCMGGALYNGLNAALGSGTIPIQFGNDPNGSNYNSNNGIMLTQTAHSSSLFHEMFHAYQNSQDPSGALANREVEAYIAEYRYLKKLSELTFDPGLLSKYENGYLRVIAGIAEKCISNQGVLIHDPYAFDLRFTGAMNLIRTEYRARGIDIPIDVNRTFNQNFKNLTNISKNC